MINQPLSKIKLAALNLPNLDLRLLEYSFVNNVLHDIGFYELNQPVDEDFAIWLKYRIYSETMAKLSIYDSTVRRMIANEDMTELQRYQEQIPIIEKEEEEKEKKSEEEKEKKISLLEKEINKIKEDIKNRMLNPEVERIKKELIALKLTKADTSLIEAKSQELAKARASTLSPQIKNLEKEIAALKNSRADESEIEQKMFELNKLKEQQKDNNNIDDERQRINELSIAIENLKRDETSRKEKDRKILSLKNMAFIKDPYHRALYKILEKAGKTYSTSFPYSTVKLRLMLPSMYSFFISGKKNNAATRENLSSGPMYSSIKELIDNTLQSMDEVYDIEDADDESSEPNVNEDFLNLIKNNLPEGYYVTHTSPPISKDVINDNAEYLASLGSKYYVCVGREPYPSKVNEKGSFICEVWNGKEYGVIIHLQEGKVEQVKGYNNKIPNSKVCKDLYKLIIAVKDFGCLSSGEKDCKAIMFGAYASEEYLKSIKDTELMDVIEVIVSENNDQELLSLVDASLANKIIDCAILKNKIGALLWENVQLRNKLLSFEVDINKLINAKSFCEGLIKHKLAEQKADNEGIGIYRIPKQYEELYNLVKNKYKYLFYKEEDKLDTKIMGNITNEQLLVFYFEDKYKTLNDQELSNILITYPRLLVHIDNTRFYKVTKHILRKIPNNKIRFLLTYCHPGVVNRLKEIIDFFDKMANKNVPLSEINFRFWTYSSELIEGLFEIIFPEIAASIASKSKYHADAVSAFGEMTKIGAHYFKARKITNMSQLFDAIVDLEKIKTPYLKKIFAIRNLILKKTQAVKDSENYQYLINTLKKSTSLISKLTQEQLDKLLNIYSIDCRANFNFVQIVLPNTSPKAKINFLSKANVGDKELLKLCNLANIYSPEFAELHALRPNTCFVRLQRENKRIPKHLCDNIAFLTKLKGMTLSFDSSNFDGSLGQYCDRLIDKGASLNADFKMNTAQMCLDYLINKADPDKTTYTEKEEKRFEDSELNEIEMIILSMLNAIFEMDHKVLFKEQDNKSERGIPLLDNITELITTTGGIEILEEYFEHINQNELIKAFESVPVVELFTERPCFLMAFVKKFPLETYAYPTFTKENLAKIRTPVANKFGDNYSPADMLQACSYNYQDLADEVLNVVEALENK